MQHILPDWIKRKIMKKVLLGDSAKASLTSFNKVRQKFGLEPIYNITTLVRGDITLLPDLPEMSGLATEKLTEGYYYTGPIFAMMDMPIAEEIKKVFSRPGVNIFCSLGSSGFPESLQLIIKALRSVPEFNVVCSTTTILDPTELGPPSENFYACRYLPAHLVNEMADIAITHGGQGTIQTAAWAGTPVVGIGFQAEQQANIDGIAQAGMAIRIPIFSLTEKRLLKAINKVQRNSFKHNAKRMQKLVRENNGVSRSVELMNRLVRGEL